MWSRISSDFIQARKEKNEVNKSILALVYSALKNRAIELRVEELVDQETIAVIKKIAKQLDEEIESNVRVNRMEKANELTYQKNLIQAYLPKQLSEDEIKNILNTLEDKSIPSVMKYADTLARSASHLKNLSDTLDATVYTGNEIPEVADTEAVDYYKELKIKK